MHEVTRVARKELWGYFSSPVAYIFLGAFLTVTLFVFFWVETFFARNLADARPLFDWMPVLLIFLVAALTMRLWSEERRAGTLETLLTLPVSPLKLVLGKFLAALGLVGLALLLTLPLPVTVSLLGPLDWGPVLGAYLATLLLAAAYIAIGLFVSARTDNPVVSLIGTTLLCGLFYLLGSNALTGLFGHAGGEILKLLGSGSRFESITRGVIDLRDLYFYVSIVGVFLALNVYTLERLRWAGDTARPELHRRWAIVTALLTANFLAGNLWLHQTGWARADITEGRVYSISDATRNYLGQLREPLLIRGYFSAQTHPLLAPLVPQLRDLLREYEVAGGGKVRVEFVDPLENPELEREAGEKFGIRPVAFQTATKYQAAVVNSYFDILVQYGGEYEKLGFRDLIEIKAGGEADLEVRLRNPEYDLTRTIKKVLYGYRGGGDLFGGLTRPVTFHGYISEPGDLPEPLPGLRADLEAVLGDLAERSGGKLSFDIRDPDAGDGQLAEEIYERFGFQPLALDLLDPRSFYFYMVLESGDQAVPVPLPESLDEAGLERALEAGIKRFTPGVLKTVALYTPPQAGGFMGAPQGGSYNELQDGLRENVTLRETDLAAGMVPEDADLLLVVGPEDLDEKQMFAIDQFLMQGGTVMIAASPYHVDLGGQAIAAREQATGLEGWLGHLGVELEETLVLDPQSTPFPIPVQRQIGGFVVEEIQTLAYPYFPDIRAEGMDEETGIVSGLGQITLTWASPLSVDAEKNADRRVIELLASSPASWTSPSADIQPDFETYPELGFAEGETRGRRVLAAAVEGRFQSFFAGKPSPLLEKGEGDEEEPAAEAPAAGAEEPEEDTPVISGVVESSPASAKLILVGSASFLTDTAISLATEATRTVYTKPVELVQNTVDWALEDRGLLALRGRGQYSRLLEPLDRGGQMFWEYLNYALALAGLALVYWLHRRSRIARQRRYAALLSEGRA
jgi:ABC-2 type transport system permease protein